MNIGIIGAGPMGRSVAGQLAGAGALLLADRNPDRAKAAVTGLPGATASSLNEAFATDIVVLALPFPGTIRFAREHALQLLGKTVVDIDNPLDKRWIPLLASPATSAAELLAQELPFSYVVKAMCAEPAGVELFIAADDESAKRQVMHLMQAAGLRPVDAGRLDNARGLERLNAAR